MRPLDGPFPPDFSVYLLQGIENPLNSATRAQELCMTIDYIKRDEGTETNEFSYIVVMTRCSWMLPRSGTIIRVILLRRRRTVINFYRVPVADPVEKSHFVPVTPSSSVHVIMVRRNVHQRMGTDKRLRETSQNVTFLRVRALPFTDYCHGLNENRCGSSASRTINRKMKKKKKNVQHLTDAADYRIMIAQHQTHLIKIKSI